MQVITSKLQEKPSALKREHPEHQNLKCVHFFLFSWVIFVLLDPGLDQPTKINTDVDQIRNTG